MRFKTKYIALCLISVGFLTIACKDNKKTTEKELVEKIVPEDLKWSERMMLSEMERFPNPSLLDFREKPKWSYTPGIVLSACSRVYEQTKKQKYYDYIYAYPDQMIDSSGTIKTYKLSNQNLDMIKSGDVLLYLYPKTKEERFLKAMETLHSQMETQLKTSDGGYWHKKIYPYQMWLDGLYMAEPFHTRYAKEYIQDEAAKQKIYDDVVLQFDLIQKHSRDEETGLLYHGWDESKEQKWANKETGNSQHFWSRGMGWYGMAMVDVLDFLPENHPGRERIITYLNQYAEAVTNVQHETGLWWQVLDQGDREGNYLEATGTSMFTYTFAKGFNNGYLPKKYLEVAKKAYSGLIDNLISVEENGLVNLNKCCGVAGLGGNPYRDGSFEYYVNEIIRSNDPKGTGPFIMASLELNK
ncbi:glycoside hydrolase family 88 protein [Flaviramulus sp. BrNp1-15]|uniref:glycoside hydrolase family 88/105 protein n=1 Tax=Flaviramulus sp. BrNp1-15 TaxID=2916754 RepID=UPI001EE8321F|nr:glycoside hydrolase family 88 protein [Flaviramulus sp. BrNp1-15]ULC59031.1 glycoside hydrolase family 88 protein [Flaviramulus sp. BrNp1-15]